MFLGSEKQGPDDQAIKGLVIRVLESIIVWEVFHNVFDITFQNITQTINGVDFYIAVVLQSVDLGTVDIVMSVQVVLRYTPIFHCAP